MTHRGPFQTLPFCDSVISPVCLQRFSLPRALPLWLRDFPVMQLVPQEFRGGSELWDPASACAGPQFSSWVSRRPDPGMVPRGSPP